MVSARIGFSRRGRNSNTDPELFLSLYVGEGKSHPGLLRSALWIAQTDVHWVRPDLMPHEPMQVWARIRYRQPLAKATLHPTSTAAFIKTLNL